MVLPFFSAYVDTAPGHIDDAEMTIVNTMYSELVFELYFGSSKKNSMHKA